MLQPVRLLAGPVVVVSLTAAVAAAAVFAGQVRLVDSSGSGMIANFGESGATDGMTPDGRYVVFVSRASNLVPRDRNTPGLTTDPTDVFVKDMRTGRITLVSTTATDKQGRDGPDYASISADGRYLAFASEGLFNELGKTAIVIRGGVPAADWTAEPITDTGGGEVLVKDRRTGRLYVASYNPADTAGEEQIGGEMPALSADGRHVAFVGYDRRSTGAATGAIYIRDLRTGALTRVDIRDASDTSRPGGQHPAISGDGRFVVFCSYSSLGAGGFGGTFLKDMRTGELRRVYRNCNGPPQISANGRFVVYPVSLGGHRYAIYDRTNGHVRVQPTWTVLNANGRYATGSDVGGGNVYVEDLATGAKTPIPLAGRVPAGVNDVAFPIAISANGRRVLLRTKYTNDGQFRTHLITVDR